MVEGLRDVLNGSSGMAAGITYATTVVASIVQLGSPEGVSAMYLLELGIGILLLLLGFFAKGAYDNAMKSLAALEQRCAEHAVTVAMLRERVAALEARTTP